MDEGVVLYLRTDWVSRAESLTCHLSSHHIKHQYYKGFYFPPLNWMKTSGPGPIHTFSHLPINVLIDLPRNSRSMLLTGGLCCPIIAEMDICPDGRLGGIYFHCFGCQGPLPARFYVKQAKSFSKRCCNKKGVLLFSRRLPDDHWRSYPEILSSRPWTNLLQRFPKLLAGFMKSYSHFVSAVWVILFESNWYNAAE